MKLEHQHVVSFSGGVCSFWAAARVIEQRGRENVTLLFADTIIEDDDLYRFLFETVAWLGGRPTKFPTDIKLPGLDQMEARKLALHQLFEFLHDRFPFFVRIADGRTPWEVFRAVRMIGNSRTDPCSKILKRELLDQWHRENCFEFTTTLYVGLDWTENHRLVRLQARKPAWTIVAPMMVQPWRDKRQMFCDLADIGIEAPALYRMGFPHNNCGGFCVKAGQAHFAHLLRTMPDRYAFHEEQERQMRELVGDHGILKDLTGGETRQMSLREFRELIEAGKEFDTLEWGGCGCAIDAPEEVKTP